MTHFATPYRLAVIDLDDTLLGPDKQISPENRDALQLLRSAGIQVVIASGRHHRDIIMYESEIGIEGWVISSQGAVVQHSQSGDLLYELTISPDLARELQFRGQQLELDMIAYHRTGVFKEIDSEWSRLQGVHTGETMHRVDFDSLADTGLQKMIWIGEPDRIEELRAVIEKEYRGRLYVVKTEDDGLEFLHPESNKVRGARVVAANMGIAPEQVIAFGDGTNDIQLLQWAGMSVAMNHGRDAAKKAARLVSPPGPPESAMARGVRAALG